MRLIILKFVYGHEVKHTVTNKLRLNLEQIRDILNFNHEVDLIGTIEDDESILKQSEKNIEERLNLINSLLYHSNNIYNGLKEEHYKRTETQTYKQVYKLSYDYDIPYHIIRELNFYSSSLFIQIATQIIANEQDRIFNEDCKKYSNVREELYFKKHFLLWIKKEYKDLSFFHTMYIDNLDSLVEQEQQIKSKYIEGHYRKKFFSIKKSLDNIYNIKDYIISLKYEPVAIDFNFLLIKFNQIISSTSNSPIRLIHEEVVVYEDSIQEFMNIIKLAIESIEDQIKKLNYSHSSYITKHKVKYNYSLKLRSILSIKNGHFDISKRPMILEYNSLAQKIAQLQPVDLSKPKISLLTQSGFLINYSKNNPCSNV